MWAPKGSKAGDSLPAVVIQNGSIQASETLYWWMAQPLVRAGYVVMTFDPRGQGRSDFMTPRGGQGGNINISVLSDGFVHVVDFFRSTPVAPYPNNLTCAGTYATEVTAFNPFFDRIDPNRLGVTGHSAGAGGVSLVQGYPGERFAYPNADGSNPIDVIVAWDALEFSEEHPPRVPAMGQTSEYLAAAPPHLTPPDPEADKNAYRGWLAAGVPVVQFTIAGSTHFDWSLLPGFPASSWCPDITTGVCEGGWAQPMIVHNTLAWLDRWLKQPGEPGFEDADARLLDDAPWCGRYSIYLRSARSFTDRGGKAHVSEDIRADCVAGIVDAPAAADAAIKSASPARFGGALGALVWLPLLLLALARRLRAAAVIFILLLAGCGSDSATQITAKDSAAKPYEGYVSETYAGTQNWLCHPELGGSANACNTDLSSLVVQADGSSSVEDFTPSAAPEVDCFYIYPTTSLDPAANSDLNPDVQEIQTTAMQAARYGATCRLFAPVYRQRTATYLVLDSAADPLVTDEAAAAALETAYADVLDAFREYIAHHNNGRGFLLLGHSQGARLGSRLLASEIENDPYLSAHLIAAHLPGFTIEAPIGSDVGGIFKNTPACRSETQTGCVIAYSAYREDDPELSEPRFGLAATPGTEALCVNPAALTGGSAPLQVYFPFLLPPAFQLILMPKGNGPYQNPVRNLTAQLQAKFFSVPGQIHGECVRGDNGVHYLRIHIAADPADPRADNYPAEFYGGTGWGMHLADVNLVQGDLVRLAGSQSAAWLAAD